MIGVAKVNSVVRADLDADTEFWEDLRQYAIFAVLGVEVVHLLLLV
jgi:hypothetical protein